MRKHVAASGYNAPALFSNAGLKNWRKLRSKVLYLSKEV